MAQPADIRLVQLGRMLGLRLGSPLEARAAIAVAPGAFAAALFHEAADNDDVTSAEAARDYLSARLHFFSDLIDASTESAVREAFDERLKAWE